TTKGVKGVYIEPSLEGLAPFIYSGGGKLFDDSVKPTTLALSSDESQDALTRTLDVLRTEQLSPSQSDVEKQPALEMFKEGELAMIAGYRNLVPSLRNTEGLNFDVMPMPTLDTETSVGDVSGLCMGVDPVSESAAADLIAHAVSADSVAEVAKAGYLVPANNEVAEGEAFLQPTQQPANAEVFNASIRDIVMPPLLESMQELEAAVEPSIKRLFYAPVLDLETLTQRIDELSAPVVAELVIRDEEKVTPSPTP
ncbi:MAG TPA: extracellular solute-binding protein, partial [Nocardioides sp.]